MRIAQILISAVLLTWLISRIGLRNVIAQLANVNGWLYGLAVAIYLVSVVIRAARWRALLTPLGVNLSLADLTRLYLLGFFWNNFLPTGFGGDVAKVIALGRTTQRGAESAMSVLAERAIGLLGTSLIALFVLLFWQEKLAPVLTLSIGLLCVGISVACWVSRLDILNWIDKTLPWLRFIARNKTVETLHKAIRSYQLKTLLLGLSLSVPFTLAQILTNYLVGLALGTDIDLKYFAIYTPIVAVVNLLPLSFNGLGVREYMYQVLFVPVGASDEQALAMGLAFNLIRVGTGMLGGLIPVVAQTRQLVGMLGKTHSISVDSDGKKEGEKQHAD